MEIKSKKEIEVLLQKSAERVRIIREKAETIKAARLQSEQETAERTIGLIKPTFSPVSKLER